METKEIWKPIKGYEGLYEVSNLGNVMSLNYCGREEKRLLRQIESRYGYLKVNLYKNRKMKTYLVHRLVAETFLPNLFNEPCINHKSEIKTDNRVENLEWCTVSYNNKYGTRIQRVSEKRINGKQSKPILQLTKTGKLVKEWISIMETKRNGFSSWAVSDCCLGKREHYKGFIWKYK